MKILVCAKQVRLPIADVALLEDESDLAGTGLSSTLNEWDAYAVEEALQLRELTSGEVVSLTCGSSTAEASARRCMAMGVDRAIRISGVRDDPFSVAMAIASAVMTERPRVVLCGAQSSDWAQAATGPALAGLIGWPVVAVVTRISAIDGDRTTLVADRELERKLIERVEVDLPAVLTIQTGVNTPRHPTLKEIKQAERRPIELIDHRDGNDQSPAYRIKKMRLAVHQSQAEGLGASPAAVAQRIAEIVAGRT